MFQRTILFFSLSFLLVSNSFSQTKTKKVTAGNFEFQITAVDTTLNDAFCSVGKMPKFPGGMSKLIEFAKQKLYYPKSAITDSVQGKVILQFDIDKTGKVINKKIFKSVRGDLDKVCLSMLNQMPNWKAGTLNGNAIATTLSWAIIFVLKT